MGLFKTIGKVVGIDDLVSEVGKTVRQVLPNAQAEREFDLAMEELKDRLHGRVHEEVLAQLEVNRVEAQHASMFVAGWRPFIGWVCGVALAWNFVVAPAASMFGVKDLLMLNIEYLISLVVTMLGASGIRTFENVKGIGRDSLKQPRGLGIAEQPVAAPEPVPTDEEENAPWNLK